MLPIHFHDRTCLSTATLECMSPKRFPPKTANEKKFLSTQQIQKNCTDMNITKIEKYKKLNMTEHKTDMNVTEIQNTKN